MAQNNWNSLGCDVSESLLFDTAKVLVDSGLRDVGYNYIILDDCWSAGRDKKGKLVEDRTKFPRGMAAVADEVHRQGLLYGMYSSAGEMTCARFGKNMIGNTNTWVEIRMLTWKPAGSLDFETQDAESFAKWGIDYLKYDNCYHMGRFGTAKISFDRYKVMGDALNTTGRPVLYSLCNWGEDFVHTVCRTLRSSVSRSGLHQLILDSGECRSQTRGGSLGISTTHSLAQMICVHAQILQIHIAWRQALTARS